jgi:hypothetical protein
MEKKFRAWTGEYMAYQGEPDLETIQSFFFHYGNCLILQHICSNDADGKPIYEGDILESPSGENFVVTWYDEEMRWAMVSKDTWYNINAGILRVAGNKYENDLQYLSALRGSF